VKKKEPLYIEEPYTCTSCGRKNLKFEEIGFKEDKNGQIDLSTVHCKTCGWISLMPAFLKYVKPGHEKDVERVLRRELKNFEANYNRRLVRRTIKKN
jgi:ribosomal protein L37AE/L43A